MNHKHHISLGLILTIAGYVVKKIRIKLKNNNIPDYQNLKPVHFHQHLNLVPQHQPTKSKGDGTKMVKG